MATIDSAMGPAVAAPESPADRGVQAAFPLDGPPDEIALRLWKIARRADELVQETRCGPGLNRVCWLIAEAELGGDMPQAAMLLSHENLSHLRSA